MKWSPIAIVVLAATVAGCLKPSDQDSQAGPGLKANANAPADLVETSAGLTYRVERVAGFDVSKLPQNSDLKMADGDVAKYAVEGCGLDAAPQFAPDRCDVYVQADPGGTLIGYAFVTQNRQGARFDTITTLNAEKQPGGGACYLHGAIYDGQANYGTPVADPSRDFEGRQMYAVSKNGAGDDLVSEVAPSDGPDSEGALGVWYLTKQGDKFRIAQERWNYCYKDPDVAIDDVFYRAVSLQKVSQ